MDNKHSDDTKRGHSAEKRILSGLQAVDGVYVCGLNVGATSNATKDGIQSIYEQKLHCFVTRGTGRSHALFRPYCWMPRLLVKWIDERHRRWLLGDRISLENEILEMQAMISAVLLAAERDPSKADWQRCPIHNADVYAVTNSTVALIDSKTEDPDSDQFKSYKKHWLDLTAVLNLKCRREGVSKQCLVIFAPEKITSKWRRFQQDANVIERQKIPEIFQCSGSNEFANVATHSKMRNRRAG